MSRSDMKPFDIINDDGGYIGCEVPASAESVKRVFDSPDGHSGWKWFRLANGDLILGVYPMGETYEEVERDAP